jgi:hypothetical protein
MTMAASMPWVGQIAEYAGRLGALIIRRRWQAYLVLLTNPGLILPPGL